MKISAQAGQQVVEVTIERRNGEYHVEVDGVHYAVDAQKLEGDFYSILCEGRSYEVSVEARGDAYRVRHGAVEQLVRLSDPSRRGREALTAAAGPQKVVAMMPGRVARVLVAEGQKVESGQGIVVIEAMKMENEIGAPRGGRVRSVSVEPGQTVEGGAELMVIE